MAPLPPPPDPPLPYDHHRVAAADRDINSSGGQNRAD